MFVYVALGVAPLAQVTTGRSQYVADAATLPMAMLVMDRLVGVSDGNTPVARPRGATFPRPAPGDELCACLAALPDLVLYFSPQVGLPLQQVLPLGVFRFLPQFNQLRVSFFGYVVLLNGRF